MRKRSGRPPRFAQVPNETVDDSWNLDLASLGLLTVLLRHKDGWDITLADIGRQYGYGEDAMAAAMGLLQVARYVVKVRVMGAKNQWRTEMAVFTPPARDAEVEELLAVIRAEDAQARRVEVIPPTATAIKKAAARREKLVKKGARRVRENPDSGLTWGNAASSQVGPDSGVSRVPGNPRVSKKTVSKKTMGEDEDAGADAVGQGAGGFARAGASDGAAGGIGGDEGGSAASAKIAPSQGKASKGRGPTRTQPRKESPGFELVRSAIPPAVASPGTKLFPGLHRAINELLDGNAAAGIPPRTPEQVIARINRRWYGENAEERAAADYRGCDRCTASGCTAPRRVLENAEGCDRIKNRNSWLAAAILAQDCPNPGCEDGQIIGGGRCRACEERHAERREAARAAADAAARWEAHSEAHSAAQAALRAWKEAEAAEERRLRTTLAQAGVWGVKLDHQVGQHMNGWRDRNPRPAARGNERQAMGA